MAKMLGFFNRCYIKLQHFGLLFSLVLIEIIMITDFSFLLIVPEIAPVLLPMLVIIYFWRKFKKKKELNRVT
ncbi:hypothetical protein [Ureibacillus endophyticus]|uniref:Uncharacterized protein n=1 Tax=Ureibacillus endophyticus TaxID=1978490 RepID=A0A494Z380_9BACL|nr:hypothetical protein [Lysinibacillus endophyticus]RKQ16951.1 hypothetical protein D8M03_08725 [Lysinibacillus endophyticus]